MNTKNEVTLIEALRKEANTSEVAKAIFTLWSRRQRTRAAVLIQSLNLRMRAAGYRFNSDQYRFVFDRLAKIGIGRLILGRGGRIRGLENIPYTLSAIGKAALGLDGVESLQDTRLAERKPVVATPKPVTPVTATPKVEVPRTVDTFVERRGTGAVAGNPVSITVVIKGKPVNFRIPKDFEPSDIAELVTLFRDTFKLEGSR